MNRAIRDFKPENFPAAQSIYAGFVERNIPAIPQPLGSRGSKGLLHEKKRKKMSVQTRFFTLIVSGIYSRNYGHSVPLNLLTQSALNRQSKRKKKKEEEKKETE